MARRQTVKTNKGKDYKATSAAKDEFLNDQEIEEAEDLVNYPEDAVHVNQVTIIVIYMLAEELGLDIAKIAKNRSVNTSLGGSVYDNGDIDSNFLKKVFEVTDLDDDLSPLTPREIALQICAELEIDTSPKKVVTEAEAEPVNSRQASRSA